MSSSCSSSSTTKVELPELTDAEKETQAYTKAAIQAYMANSGYDITSTPTTKPKNQAKVDSLTDSVATLQDRLSSLQGKIKTASADQKGALSSEINAVQNQLNKTTSDLANEEDNTVTDFDVKIDKQEDPRVTDMVMKGDLGGAKKLKDELKQQELTALNDKDSITKSYTDAVKTYFATDWNTETNAANERIRGPVLAALTEMETAAKETQKKTESGIAVEGATLDANINGMNNQFNTIIDKINQTGLSGFEALTEMDNRAKQTGSSMMEALDETVKTSRALAEQNLFIQTRNLRVASNQRAAALGRASTDPAMVRDLNQAVTDAQGNLELNMFVKQADGKLSITQETGKALQDIQGLRTQFTIDQGRQLQNVEVARGGMIEQTGLRREALGARGTEAATQTGLKLEDISKARGSLAETLATRKEDQMMALKQGLPMTGSQLAGGVQSYFAGPQAATAAQLAAGQGMGTDQEKLDTYIRGIQTTTTQTSSPSVFGSILSGIGMATEGFGSVMKGLRG